jgi:ABC-type polysaccharide/polyol phosphate export permease
MLHYKRDLFLVLLKKELASKYQGSILGLVWTFLNPLLSIVVYYIVFALILKLGDKKYLNYLISGVLYWNFVSSSFLGLTYSFVNNSSIIKRLPVSLRLLTLANLISNAIPYFVLTFLFLVVINSFPYVLLSVAKLILSFMLTGIFLYLIGFTASTLNTFIKDTGYLISFFLNLLFYLTPIVYYTNAIPHSLKFLLYINPFFSFLVIWRWAVLGAEFHILWLYTACVHIFLAFVVYKWINKKLVWLIPETL